jgi:hypothetical protein
MRRPIRNPSLPTSLSALLVGLLAFPTAPRADEQISYPLTSPALTPAPNGNYNVIVWRVDSPNIQQPITYYDNKRGGYQDGDFITFQLGDIIIIDAGGGFQTGGPQFERISNGEARDDEVVFHAPAAYWKSWFTLEPAKMAAQLKDLAILILQGKRDYQITEADLDLFKKALAGRDEVTVHLYANLNHIFFPAGPRGTDLDYFGEGHVDAGVVEDIAAWVAKRK